MARPNELAKPSWMMSLASIAVIVAALYLAKGVLVPFALAVLLSFLLSPVCDWLERRRLARIPAVLVTALLGFTVLGVALWTATVQIAHLGPQIPEYRRNLEAKLSSVNEYAAAALSQLTRTTQGIGHKLSPSVPVSEAQGTNDQPYLVRVISEPASPLQVIGGTFGTLLQVLGSTGIVIVLVIFFLIRREDLRDRFIRLVGRGQVTLTTQVLEDAALRVSRYLSMQFLINVIFGVVVAAGLYLIGVPNAALWGILAAALRFIPYIGPWVAAAMPIALSLAISLNWKAPILTVALFVVLELLTNNVLEPWLYGKNTGISAVAVLVAAIFWTWLWGMVGLLLATPLTVCLLVIGKHVPQLSFLDTLLGNEPVFEPKNRIYQRLLAGDQEEAAELLDEYLEDQPLVEVYDTILIPALALAETHWHRGELTESRHRYILQSMKEIIEELGQREPERLAQSSAIDMNAADEDSKPLVVTDPPRVCIPCLPARDEADEIAAMMLAQLLERSGCVVQLIAVTDRPNEMVDLVEQREPTVICISATPPAAVIHARSMCARLRARMPNVQLVVGLWNTPSDNLKAKKRIGGGANTHVVATLAEALEQLRLRTQPRSTQPETQAPPESDHIVMAGENA